jgi:tetratricopeptide (TPR) repeat protein
MAKAYLERYEDAIADCNAAIKLNFVFTDAFIQRGLYKNELDRFDEAMKDFDQAIKLEENNPLIYFYRGAAKIKVGDTLAAMQDFNRVIELDPQNDLTYYNRAILKMEMEDYTGAMEDLKNVLRVNPENVYTWYNLGYANMQLERYEDALDSYTRAIEIFPDFAAAYMSRAGAKQELGDYEGAKNDHDIGIGIINAVNSGEDFGMINERFSADSSYMKRIIEFEADFNSNNVSGGQIQYQQVFIQLRPNFNIVYLPTEELNAEEHKTGYFYAPLDHFKYSGEDYSFGISGIKHTLNNERARYLNGLIDSVQYFDPFDQENYFRKGTFNAMMLNYNDAFRAFNRAIELKPDYLEAYFNRANINFELIEHQFSIEESAPQITITQGDSPDPKNSKQPGIPDFSSVLADYDRVIELDPKMSFAYYNRGNIKNRMRDFEGAIQDYTAAMTLQPNFAEAFYNRALTLIYLKNTRDACLDLSKAGELGVQDAYNVIKRYCNK